MGDQLHDACGVVGVYRPGGEASRIAFFGIFSLQHRGQESAGIATFDDSHREHLHRGNGLVAGVFNEYDLENLPGELAIGHTRYSTTGITSVENSQPIRVSGPNGTIFVAHNGNIVNSVALREELEEKGVRFLTTSDSEVAAFLLAYSPGLTWEDRIKSFMTRAQGAYSFTILTDEAVYGVRDPHGFRPLCYGELDGGWIIASETCALDNVGGLLVREIEPGEILKISSEGIATTQGIVKQKQFCIFENIYFSRPDSILNGGRVYSNREKMGAQLFRESHVPADIVTAIPDSAIPASIGYANESGLPYRETLIKNRNSGRTFIEPTQALREAGVRAKYTPLVENIKGKKVILIDDSVVRGTTTRQVIKLLRTAGAKEIHLRVSSPPIKFSCHYGVDMPNPDELIASNRTLIDIQKELGVDSLAYLEMQGLKQSVNGSSDSYCDACFTGNYPVPVQLELGKMVFESPKK